MPVAVRLACSEVPGTVSRNVGTEASDAMALLLLAKPTLGGFGSLC